MKKEYNYLKNKSETLHLRRRKRNICRIRGVQPYNPVLMRFTGFDPLASKYPAISPFAYCANNPVTDRENIILFDVSHINRNGNPAGTRGQVSTTNATLYIAARKTKITL